MTSPDPALRAAMSDATARTWTPQQIRDEVRRQWEDVDRQRAALRAIQTWKDEWDAHDLGERRGIARALELLSCFTTQAIEAGLDRKGQIALEQYAGRLRALLGEEAGT